MANGLGLTYPLQLGNSGYFETTTDVLTQVKTNLKNLLLTQRGERMFQPNFGCDLALVIFELQTDDGLADVTAIIQTAVQNWMPFVRVNGVLVKRDEDNNKIAVSVSFTLLSNNITDSIVLVF